MNKISEDLPTNVGYNNFLPSAVGGREFLVRYLLYLNFLYKVVSQSTILFYLYTLVLHGVVMFVVGTFKPFHSAHSTLFNQTIGSLSTKKG